ncbi:uncharacterized protein LOC131806936 [Musca domestica]|uniref:RNA-directed DNA polymerase n=1 Tax=Musca domestica TaxID=7370 RepID=A0ABM3VPX2_MUSDO|nr:uncharacterized protein LOC131806936 [Musca domestica]
MKVKISSLKVAELDKLLLARSLPRTGNKSEKIARLMACNGNDEVEVEDSESQEDFHGFDEAETGDDSLTSQMRELKDIMLTLARSVQQLTTLSTERAITSNAGLNSRDTEQQVPAEVISRQSGSGTSGCLKDYIVMIPDFDPIKGNVTSVQFIDKVETLQRLHGWSDETTLFAVHHKMSGVAKMWIDALPVVETWKEFRQQFLKDFPSRVSVADIHRELIARKRNSNESLVEYYYAMLAIGKRGSVDEASILSYIINGLNDSSLTRTLLAMNPQTCSELLRSLENLTIQTYARKQTKNDEDDKTVSVSGGAPTKGVKCFNCNRFGHISTSCPQPLKKPKCSKCAKIGHDASQCKGKGTTVAAMTEESKDYCPPVMKDVTVNGKTYEGFVDTGSDFTLMRKAVVPEGCDMEVTSKRMKGFGGSIVEVVEMFEANVVIDEESLMTTIYVVPNDLMRYDVLLGRDVLCKKQTKLTIEHGVLKVKSTMPSTFNVGESLDEHQKEKLDQILSSFKDCFAETLEDLGKCFNIVTDCNSIATTKATSPLPPRIARWWFKLQEFDFTITHRSGAKMTHVDGMSRSPTLPSSQSRTVAENVLALTTNINDWVYQLQMSDKKLKHIFEVLNGNLQNEANEIKQIKADYVIENGRLFRKVNNMKRMVIPERVRWRITKACHDDLGHFGEEKTLQRLQRDFWFPRMRRYVKSYIQSCPECCYNKVKGGKAEGELHIEEVLPIPFRSINIDHMGPFPKSKKGNQYVFLIVCSFSKYTIIKPTRNTKTAPVITALREVMSIFGQPRRIVSDKGTAFTSKEFQQFVEYNGIQHVQTAVRTPRANGQAERINQTVLNALKCLVGDTKEWDTETTTIQWSINSQLNATTKFSPNDLIFNFSLRDVSYNRIIQAVGDEERENFDVRVIQQQAVANIQKQKEKWKARFDSRHSKPTQYKEGDLVVIDTVPQPTGESHKLDARYKGPYIVTKIIGNDRYLVEDLPDLSLKQRKYCGVMSTDHMKPWCYGDPSLEIEDKDESDDVSPRRDEESGEAELSTIKMSL